MKKLLVIALALGSLSVFAQQQQQGKSDRFQQRKDRQLKNIGKRIELLTSAKNCIAAASSADHLKKCRESNKKAMMQLKQEAKTYRDSMKAQRKLKKGSN